MRHRGWALLLAGALSCAGRNAGVTGANTEALSARRAGPVSYCEDGVCDAGETAASCPWDCQPPVSLVPDAALRPAVAVQTVSGTFHQFFPDTQSSDGTWRFEDAAAIVQLRHTGDGRWTAQITAKQPLNSLSFPWMPRPYALPAPSDDDRVYYPFLGGIIERDRARAPFAWWGLPYPGGCFAPLVIAADATQARIVAATNWPPRRVNVFIAHGQVQLLYNDALVATGETRTLGALVRESRGDRDGGDDPWLRAMEFYAAWLREHARDEAPPAWLQHTEGFLMSGLQNMPAFDLGGVRAQWSQWRASLGWVQFWGQMSNFAGDPRLARPARGEHEPVGCCVPRADTHPRYGDSLWRFSQEVTAQGGRVGFYAAPSGGRLDRDEGVRALRAWLERNRARGANAYYVDVLGRAEFGDPARVRALFDDGTIPVDAAIEGFVDVYPRAPLLSGMLNGNSASRSPREDERTCERCAFPALARVLLGTRVAFAGVSNGDHTHFGPRATPAYDGERALFLLGFKYELDQPDPFLRSVFEERARVRFWDRAPRYRHTLGLTAVPDGVTVRRFDTSDGAVLLAVDNPQRTPGLSVRLHGHEIALPTRPLALVEVPDAHRAR